MSRKCLRCKKEFKVVPSVIKRGHGNFCSPKCRLTGKGNPRFGKHCSKKTKEKMSNTLKNQFKNGRIVWNKNKTHMQGKNHPLWLGGKYINQSGYIYKHSPNHPYKTKGGYVRIHRLIIEKYLGRYLDPEERIHHINSNKTDNRIRNLLLFKNESEHQSVAHKSK